MAGEEVGSQEEEMIDFVGFMIFFAIVCIPFVWATSEEFWPAYFMFIVQIPFVMAFIFVFVQYVKWCWNQ